MEVIKCQDSVLTGCTQKCVARILDGQSVHRGNALLKWL